MAQESPKHHHVIAEFEVTEGLLKDLEIRIIWDETQRSFKLVSKCHVTDHPPQELLDAWIGISDILHYLVPIMTQLARHCDPMDLPHHVFWISPRQREAILRARESDD